MKMEIVAARKFGKTMKVARITSLAKHALKYKIVAVLEGQTVEWCLISQL